MPTVTGISLLLMRLSNTVGAFHCMPSWFTYTQAGLSGRYCEGIYIQYSRHVPGKILDSAKVNFNTSPFGTPACSSLAGSTGYFSAGACANKMNGETKSSNENIFFIVMVLQFNQYNSVAYL